MLEQLVEKLRSIYEDGVTTNPGYSLGERVRMFIDTKRDIDKLPDTTQQEGTE